VELSEKVIEGNADAVARLMRGIEDEVQSAIEELERIFPHTGRAYVVG